MLKLHDNAFSPFARKVRLVLDLKKLPHEVVDGLALENRERLAAVNPRVEVPALEDRGVVVIGSSDIVAYLERVYPDAPVYPAAHADWVHARAWERCADTVIDPILIDVSYWMWAERPDTMPAGMLDAARQDMARVYDALERDLGERSFLGGDRPCIADVALFPHIASTPCSGLRTTPRAFPACTGGCSGCAPIQRSPPTSSGSRRSWQGTRKPRRTSGGSSSGAATASSGCWRAASTGGS